jgi:hypothetical protein
VFSGTLRALKTRKISKLGAMKKNSTDSVKVGSIGSGAPTKLTPKYVFIGEDGATFSITDHPTRADLRDATVGRIIVRLADGFYYGREGKWLPAPAGERLRINLDGVLMPIEHYATEAGLSTAEPIQGVIS